MRATVLNRKLHRWGAILIALPLLIVVLTGILLQLKKQVDWIQPPTRQGTAASLAISFDDVLRISRGVSGAGIAAWSDIERLDVRPDLGVLKVRARNRCEIQIETATGAVLQVAERRSDLIESIHDGSFFFDGAKFWLFLPSAVILLGLLGTGVYLFFLPQLSRRRRNRRRADMA